jgi:hypothetical protein
MPVKPSAVFTIMAVASTAGIIAAAVASDKQHRTATATLETLPEPVLVAAPQEPIGRLQMSDKAMRILISTLITLILICIALLTALPLVNRAMPAANDEIRSHYGINVIDNPEFTGSTFLKGGDDGLACICDRPSRGDIISSKDLTCRLP